MNNNQFLQTLKKSFLTFLQTHSRSNKKLVVLHGDIAKNLKQKLGEKYEIKSLGLEKGKEGKLDGRYMDKKVDILISRDNVDLAGIGIKFVMNNYSQNSNNYFENMLGETANIRTNDKDYFQILVIPEEMPYFSEKGKIKKWDKFTKHNVNKYVVLSKDITGKFFHTPVKTLLFIIKFPIDNKIKTKEEYKNYYLKQVENFKIEISKNIVGEFGNSVIFNDYKTFLEKITHYIKSI